MLRKRSRPAPTAPRTTSCQQAPMADNGPHPSPPAGKQRGGPTTSLFPSPKLSTRSITVKEVCDTETIITSPTSILDAKPFSHLKSSFWSELNTPRILDSKPIGLAIVDALKDEKLEPNMCASHFKIQIPKTPCDFGTKTRSSQLDLVSPTLYHSSAKLEAIAKPPGIFSRVISASEMELSEDYTCVISHGPNPKTTHIFDDCIVESCCGGFLELSDHGGKESGFDLGDDQFRFPCESFLSFCQTCKKSLGDGEDIYMYRGEKAFCSAECRQHEIMLEEGMAKTGI